MKKLTTVLFLSVCVMGWVACKKSKDNTPDPVYPKGLFANINGVPWKAAYVNKITSSGSLGYGFQLDGPDTATKETLYIEIPSFSGKGSATITATSEAKAYYSLDTTFPSVKIYATSGTISVTALNDTAVGGTFNFTAGSKTITEGTFNVSL